MNNVWKIYRSCFNEQIGLISLIKQVAWLLLMLCGFSWQIEQYGHLEAQELPKESSTIDDSTYEAQVSSKLDDSFSNDSELSEEQLKRLSNDPSFQEFSTLFDQMIQIPESSLPSEKSLLLNPSPLLEYSSSNEESLTNSRDFEKTECFENVAFPKNIEITKDGMGLEELESLTKSDFSFLSADIVLSDSLKEKTDLLKARQLQLISFWIDAVLNSSQIGHRAKIYWKNKEDCFDMSDGQFVVSADFWHLALHGPFFFQVRNPESNELFYTKAGDFEISSTGQLQLKRATTLFELTPEITIPDSNEIQLSQNGTVYASSSELDSQKEQIGKIELIYFRNPMRLFSNDGVFFQETEQSGKPQKIELSADSPFGIFSSSLELSNGRENDIIKEIKKIQSLLQFLNQ